MRLIVLFILVCQFSLFGQVVTDPFFPTQNDFITITYDASQGNQDLDGESPIYIH